MLHAGREAEARKKTNGGHGLLGGRQCAVEAGWRDASARAAVMIQSANAIAELERAQAEALGELRAPSRMRQQREREGPGAELGVLEGKEERERREEMTRLRRVKSVGEWAAATGGRGQGQQGQKPTWKP
ncbi:hypothetical protein NUW54_g11224 [Trametes sanguinea]|uniref:Uncharacterized protein n=1 Tax=Trametes sanguinea TaxID=158606 RepID=A0ACC1NJ16_9APHY|nr:hypothetical protein NUW54_g11224 [Trametes sanguinea]